jgi:hypothetical protein
MAENLNRKILSMKKLFFFLLLPLLSQAEGLIKAPENAEEVKSPGKILDLDFSQIQDGPQEATLDGYVRWILERRTADRKSFMATRARALRPQFNVACLKHFEAYGFEKVSETEYRMNCLAGSGQNISHILDYHFKLTANPDGCDSDATVREFFTRAGMFTEKNAKDYLNSLVSTCRISIEPMDANKPVVKMVKVPKSFVNEVLEEKEELNKYVNQSKKVKQAPEKNSNTEIFKDPLSDSVQ